MSVSNPKSLAPAVTLDEWVEKNGFTKFRSDVICHVQNAAPEDIARMVMTSLRQEMESRGGKRS